MGSQIVNQPENQRGIIPRVIDHIFDTVNSNKNKYDYLIRVSYIEIYNENLKCLLSPKSSVALREHESKGVIVVGAKEEIVESSTDMYRCLETGALYRTTGSTLMNQHSSRSHSIFTIFLEKRAKDSNSANDSESLRDSPYTTAKFHLIDLAGSERNKRTNTTGIRFKEAIQINCGLLALGNVISALGDEKKRRKITHVPYRDSKLTRLLQNSLGGNSKTLMLACVSPADSNFEETLNTLKYAHRTRNIKNKPIVNRDPHAAELTRMKMQIQSLQAQLRKQQNGEIDDEYVSVLHEMSNEELSQFKADNDALSRQLSDLKEELMESNDTISELTVSRVKYQRRLKEIGVLFRETKKQIAHIERNAEALTSSQSQTLRSIIKRVTEFADMIESEESDSSKISTRLQNREYRTATPTRPVTAPAGSSSNNPEMLFHKVAPSQQTGFSSDPDAVLQKQIQYIHQLEEELKEAKADLYRDEQIFSDKVKEIKKLKRQNHDLKKQLNHLKNEKHERSTELIFGHVSAESENDRYNIAKSGKSETSSTEQNEESNRFYKVPELEELESNIKQLKVEKNRLLDEKNRIEVEKERIEEQTRREKEEVLAAQEKVKSQMSNLSIMIRLKEELIRDLVKSDNESKVQQLNYEDRIKSLEDEMKDSQKELERVLVEIEEKTVETQTKEKEKSIIKDEYKSKLQKMKQEMSKLKKKFTENRSIARDKQKSDKRIKELEDEVNRMKSHQKILKNKMKQETDRLEEKTAERTKQITELRRDAQESHKRIKELEQENQRKQVLLVRKSEKLQRFQAELLKYAEYEKERKANREKRAWLDREVEKYLKKKDIIDRLEKELKRREEIISKREAYLGKRERMKSKRFKKSQMMKESITSLSKQISELEEEIREKKQILAKLDRKTQDHSNLEIHSQLKDLKHQRARALHQKKQLEDKHEEQQYRDEEKLREIDDMTEVLDAEIEYKNEEIEKAQNEIEQEGAPTIHEQFAHISDVDDAKQLLSEYFNKVIDLKEGEKRIQDRESELEVNLKESERLIENLNNNIKLTEAVYERRLIKQAREYELKIQMLMKELQEKNQDKEGGNSEALLREKDEQLSILQKDNWYYRKTNSSLKNKVKELQEELKNVKAHFSMHSVTPVRKSMSSMRPISRDELQERNPSTAMKRHQSLPQFSQVADERESKGEEE